MGRIFLRMGGEPGYNKFMGLEEKGQLGISICREMMGQYSGVWGQKALVTTHSIVSAAVMRRNQIAVVGGGGDEAAASTHCLFEKYVRKCKVKIE